MNAFTIRLGHLLLDNKLFICLLILCCADMVFGTMRALKNKKLNSTIGIDGGIRKVAMVSAVVATALIDLVMTLNVFAWLPEEAQQTLANIGFDKLALAELFTLMFCLYEAASVLKNAALCGLPMPKGMRVFIVKWLDILTEETEAAEEAA